MLYKNCRHASEGWHPGLYARQRGENLIAPQTRRRWIPASAGMTEGIIFNPVFVGDKMLQSLTRNVWDPLILSAVLCFSVIAFASSTHACSFDRQGDTTEDFFKTAKTAFIAHITKTEEKIVPINDSKSRKKRDTYLEATFEVIEVLKGTPPESGTVHDLVPDIGNCSIGLIAGRDYLFMPDELTTDEKLKASEYGVLEYNYVGITTGSIVLPPYEHKKAIELLNRLRALVNKPEKKQDRDK